MLDSKAVAAVQKNLNDRYTLYIRADYIENLGIYSFRKHLKEFATERDAMLTFKKLYPMGNLVPFDDLPRP